MKLLRNPEIRRELILDLAATLLFTLIGLWIRPLAGLLLLLLGLALSVLHLYLGARRYARIADLSLQIDRILHGEAPLLIDRTGEGELSILYAELHKMTTRLNEQTEQLQADKVRLTEVIADIFHQIRTPLTAMNLSIAMQSDPDLSPDRRQTLLHEQKKQSERIRWLVETLLKLSKIDAGTAQFRPEPIRVQTLLDRAAEPFRIPIELQGQTLLIEAADETAVCDPAWTVEALGNLFKNATEHTPAGGTIRVTAQETPLFTELVFSDTGEGFDPTDIPHLFERYYKGKNAGADSIGIGLALTRQVLAAQNATIAAANGLHGGAVFTVRFYKAVV